MGSIFQRELHYRNVEYKSYLNSEGHFGRNLQPVFRINVAPVCSGDICFVFGIMTPPTPCLRVQCGKEALGASWHTDTGTLQVWGWSQLPACANTTPRLESLSSEISGHMACVSRLAPGTENKCRCAFRVGQSALRCLCSLGFSRGGGAQLRGQVGTSAPVGALDSDTGVGAPVLQPAALGCSHL